jgi:chromate transporter
MHDEKPPSSATAPAIASVSLLKLFLMSFQIGILSFGGGLTGWIFQETVARRRWMSEDEFLSGLALCQVLPGINVANLMIYVGQRLRGVLGAIVAVVGLLVGPFFIVIGLVMIYEKIAGLSWLHALLDGAAAAALGLLFLVGFKAAARVAQKPWALAILGVVVVTVGLLQWPLVPIALGLAPFSVALAWWSAAPDA